MLVDAATLRQAETQFFSCEHCNPEDAVFLFDSVLDVVTGNDARVTDYLLVKAAHCPRCAAEVVEQTLVEWYPDDVANDTPPGV